MSDYSRQHNFTVKDGLTPGDPNKKILGAEHDDEYNAVQTAVNSKVEKNNGIHTGTAQFQDVSILGELGVAIIDGGTY